MLHNLDTLKMYFKEQKDAKENKRPTEKKTSSKDVASTYLEPTYAERKVDNIYSFVRLPTNKLFVCFS